MIDYIKNNISTIISVLAIGLTLAQYLSNLIKNRENFKVQVDNIQLTQSGKKYFCHIILKKRINFI